MEAASAIPQLFGIIPTGSPLIITPTTAPSPTSYTYKIPLPSAPCKPFNHLTVFLLPGIVLPPSTVAAVYLSLPQSPNNFRFMGAIGTSKESAVFKVSGIDDSLPDGEACKRVESCADCVAEVDMDSPGEVTESVSVQLKPSAGEITIGISIESAEAVAAQIASLQIASSVNSSTLKTPFDGASQAMVLANRTRSDILILAHKIIKDAFNFLSSYSSSGSGGEMVPLKAFEEWWRKFESKCKSNPGFLEKSYMD